MERYVVTLRCVDAPGVIHAMSSALLGTQSNILEQAQYTDEATGLFSMRTRFETPQDDVEEVRTTLVAKMANFDPIMSLRREDEQCRVLIMVSQQDHCLADLLYRHANGELPIDIQVIVSNHENLRKLADRHGIPFVFIPVTAKTKEASERELLALIDQHAIDVVVLARYMQILSKELCATLEGRIINIHHSFLPGFKGARPYQQAYDRGVKLIGATAHFVTADLDEGPIIEQNVHRVQHNHSAADLAEIGRDVERLVLARAVRLYAEDRVLLDGQRTVIFA
ncbi:MAG: formyltetrahydrofolate deformylase [Candidatus Nanopelagicales bacterium]|nr:formyltetrahydrofolate deformylase [Actinomycetota bacterium]